MNVKSLVLVSTIAALAPWAAFAATDAPASTDTQAQAQSATAKGAYSDGEIKKVDHEQNKVTIKHGTIENLGMPGMTMVFRADAATLANVNAGDLVKFKADRVDGALKVTELIKR